MVHSRSQTLTDSTTDDNFILLWTVLQLPANVYGVSVTSPAIQGISLVVHQC